MSLYPDLNQGITPSKASEFIRELVESGQIRRAPDRIRGKEVGWKFSAETDELVGYDALVGKSGDYTSINLDKIVKSMRGSYSIKYIGPFKIVGFDGKVGNAPDRRFLVVDKDTGTQHIGFFVG